MVMMITIILIITIRFLYISETVSIYLGLSQVELTGSSLFDYIHQVRLNSEHYCDDCFEDYSERYCEDFYEELDLGVNQADHEELAQQLGVTIHGPGSESPVREGEEGATSPLGAAPPIPDGKPCKW